MIFQSPLNQFNYSPKISSRVSMKISFDHSSRGYNTMNIQDNNQIRFLITLIYSIYSKSFDNPLFVVQQDIMM